MAETVSLTKSVNGDYELTIGGYLAETFQFPRFEYVTNAVGIKLKVYNGRQPMKRFYKPSEWTINYETGFTTIKQITDAITAMIEGIPNIENALFWLDGFILDNQFLDRSGHGRHFTITGKDFSDDWVFGFPYKSAATISAPVGDATLIAADINNFLYASNGTPNQIPVISLFQDVDYEHRLFSRHIPQVLDLNGIEIQEPKVIDIVFYNTVKSGDDLDICQLYYGVPTESLTAKWVAKTGNDSTGNGSKANPYLTIIKAKQIISAGGTVYVKSGTYTENESNLNLFLNKEGTYKGLGNVIIKGGNTGGGRVIYAYGTNTITIEGFTADGEGSRNPGLALEGGTKIANKCRTINVNGNGAECASTTVTISNSIFTNSGVYVDPTTATISGCTIITNGDYYSLTSGAGTGTLNFIYNKVKPTSTAKSTLLWISASVTINAKHNDFDLSNVVSKRLLYYPSSKTQTVNFEYNNVFSSAIATSLIDCDTATNISTSTIKNNRFELTNTGNFSSAAVVSLFGQLSPKVSNNTFLLNTTYPLTAIKIAANTVSIGTPEIKNNYFKSKSNSGYVISIGTETSGAADNLITPIIEGNRIQGSHDFGDSTSGNTHTIFVGHNINPTIRYNYLSGCHIGMVLKHTGGTYSTDKICYNLLKNCGSGILVKGVNSAKIYQNAIESDFSNARGIYAESHSVDTSNLLLKNNIIKVDSGYCIEIPTGTNTGLQSNNNVLKSTSSPIRYLGSDKTYSEWNALGFDIDSFNVDPNLTDMIPLSDFTGVNLGVNYINGLDISTNWSSIIIVTKEQPDNWHIGAYIK